VKGPGDPETWGPVTSPLDPRFVSSQANDIAIRIDDAEDLLRAARLLLIAWEPDLDRAQRLMSEAAEMLEEPK